MPSDEYEVIISEFVNTLTDEECDQFRRLPCSFRDMVREIYAAGLKNGIRRYAHYRDGSQYVGTTGRTLKQAIEDVDAKR